MASSAERDAPPIQARILGVPVRIAVDDANERERVLVAHSNLIEGSSNDAVMPAADRDAAPIAASLRHEAGRWLPRIDGREIASDGDAVSALRRLNHEILQEVMRRRADLFFVHAAAVVRAGRAIALPGLSGAGKSTLAVALVARGAHFLSDEILAFDPRTRLVLPVPRSPKIRDVCLPYFPALAGRFVGRGEGRFLSLPGAAIGTPSPLGFVVSPRWSAAGDGLEPRSAGRALLDLTASALNFGARREGSIDVLALLLEGARCARLEWSDPWRAANRIVEFTEAAP